MTDKSVAYDVAVIGGGAAGIVAAISASRNGASVIIIEKMPKLGKKILVSGAGRCNLSNDSMDDSFFNPEAKTLVRYVFSSFGGKEILHFFKELGLMVYSDNGKIYPVTNQSTSVMEVLEMELHRLAVDIKFHSDVDGISAVDADFKIKIKSGGQVTARKVMVCGGGRSYPVSGSDGGMYPLLKHFGHSIIEPVPSTVPIIVKDNWFHDIVGQRVRAKVANIIEGVAGQRSEGDLIFTKYGLSGTAILDVSEEISIEMNRFHKKNISVVIDLVPFMSEEELRAEISRRIKKNIEPSKLLAGILPYKFANPLSDILKTKDPLGVVKNVKKKKFTVSGTRGWDEAEFTAGGIDTEEVNIHTLESKCHPGLFLAGEVLNVQGKRGGYNLAWAWASGFVAGSAAGLRS
ncbi:MAG TPA: aminoacetone oxidase family FAD-binding enzyme [Candidatus Omnitrophota bacterium]|nr:aminoacetone oxidase family FAD-binding enzyme [Candidatus Omnitrophota bacterium]